MGEHSLTFHTELDPKTRAIFLRVPIDLTLAEADQLKRHIDELVNSRQPNDVHLQEIRDVCSRHGCTLDEIRVNTRRPRDLVVMARTTIVHYLAAQGFNNAAIADFIHRDVSTINNMKSKRHA